MGFGLGTRSRVPAFIAGLATAAIAGGGLAYAAIPSADGSINACYAKHATLFAGKGAVRIVDVGQGCAQGEVPISWNQKGIKGDPGPIGPQGEPGTSSGAGLSTDYVWNIDYHSTPNGTGTVRLDPTRKFPAGSRIEVLDASVERSAAIDACNLTNGILINVEGHGLLSARTESVRVGDEQYERQWVFNWQRTPVFIEDEAGLNAEIYCDRYTENPYTEIYNQVVPDLKARVVFRVTEPEPVSDTLSPYGG